MTINSNLTSSLLSSSTSSLLGDWMAIKNGSYKRLMKAYYAKEKTSSDSKTDSTTKTNKDKTAPKELTNLKSDASSLKSAANAVSKKSLFEKVTKTTKDENGEEVTVKDYDRDAIYNAVKAFADAYNDTLDSATKQDNVAVLKKVANMTKTTATNQNSLKDVGITIGKDNKLIVNEEKLKSADIGTLKTLFSGYGSYASSMGQKASDLVTMSDQLIKTASKGNASLYTNSGNYSLYSNSNAFDKFF